jgi:putative oxidoreductase
MKNIFLRLLRLIRRVDFLGPLLARLTVGYVFVTSGYGKVTNLERVIGYFESLNIPAPRIQAPMIAGLELIGGLVLILGLGTRVAAMLLTGVMGVAILSAKKEALESFGTLSETSEFLYLVMLVWLMVAGAGRLSADHFVKARFEKEM